MLLKKFKIIHQLIKESINPEDIIHQRRILPRYQYTNSVTGYTYIFSIELSGHSIDQFDVRRFHKITPFTTVSLEEGLDLYYQKIQLCLQEVVNQNYLSNIKYRKEQSFLFYCTESRLGFVAVIKNNGPRDIKSGYFSCTITTTLPFYNSEPEATEPDDIPIKVLCESINHLFNCYFVEINC